MSVNKILHRNKIMTKILAIVILSALKKSLAYDDTISCHNDVIKDDLPSADDYKHFFPEKSIFFIETSCNGGIDSRQACSIESAAKSHPRWQINVMFASPVPTESQNKATMKVLRLYNNIKFLRIHVAKFGEGTPLASILGSGILNRSRWRVSHTSDVLRFLTLYKWAGVYLDLDVIVIRPFDSLNKNWVAKENYYSIGAAHISSSNDKIGRVFINATIRELETNLVLDEFSYIGPLLVKRVMEKICSTTEVSHMSADSCKGIEVYENKYFFHYSAPDWKKYFISGYLDTRETYAIHAYNSLSRNVSVSKHSPYAKLAKMFCPKMHRLHRHNNWKI